MKRLFGLVLVTGFTLALSGCFLFTQPRTDTVVDVLYEDYWGEKESSRADIYFYEREEVPYMEVSEFLELSDSLIDVEDITYNNTVEGFNVSYTSLEPKTTRFHLDYNWEKQEITVNHFEFFGGLSLGKDYDLESYYTMIQSDDNVYLYSNEVTLSLSEYNLSGESIEEGYTLPIALLNLLFTPHEVGLYFSGDALYSVWTDDVYYYDLNINDFNFHDVPMDLQIHTLEFLGFYFDYFYGLNQDKEELYYLELIKEEYVPKLNDVSNDFYQTLDYMLLDFDDMHLWFDTEGMYGMEGYSYDQSEYDFTGRTLLANQAEEDLKGYCEETESKIINDEVTLISIPSFDEYSPEIFAYEYDLLATDTTQKIVIDLSCNSGGYAQSVVDILPYFMDSNYVMYQENFRYGSQYTYSLFSPINKISEKVYIRTSPISYSAANIFAFIMQENGAIVFGEESTGGSSFIDAVFAPAGVQIYAPTHYHMTTEDNDYMEYGTNVDYLFESYTEEDLLIFLEQIG